MASCMCCERLNQITNTGIKEMTDWARLLREANGPGEKADIISAMEAERQRECPHYDCEPTEWYWSGQIRNMHCNDCGLNEFREEVE